MTDDDVPKDEINTVKANLLFKSDKDSVRKEFRRYLTEVLKNSPKV